MNPARYLNQLILTVAVILLLNTVSEDLSAQEVTLKGHSGAVMMATFAAEDGRVVTASSDQTAKLWDAVSGAELQTFSQHTGPLYCLAVSADGRTMITGAQDNTVRVWDLPLSHPIRRVTAPGAAVMDIAFSPDGTMLLAGSADHSVRLIDLRTHTTAVAAEDQAAMLPTALPRVGHTSDVLATAYRNDGTSFATADATGHILVWSPDLDQPLARLQGHPGKVTALVLPNNDQRLASAGDDGIIRVWQLPTQSPKKLLESDVAGGTIAVLPGQQVAIYALANGLCRLTNLLTGEVQREFPQPDGETTQIAVSPTSSWFGRANTAGSMQVINVNDASIIGSIAGHDGAIKDVAVCLDGLRFLTAGADGTMRLWKQPITALPMSGHSGVVRGLAASSGGQWSLTISDDMTIRRWNAVGALDAQYGNHTQPLRAVAIRDDDALFATGDAEGTVWVWDAANGAAQGVVSAHSVAVTALAFSADRTSLITAAADGTIRSWTLPLPAQKPADGVEPIRPAWEFKSLDGAGILQLSRLSQEQGLVALTVAGTSIVRLRWDGTTADPIASPSGVLRRLDVAANGSAFLATSDAGIVHVFEINGTLRKSMAPIAGLTSARFDRDGAFVAVCRAQPSVQIVNVATGQVHEELATGIAVIDAGWTGVDQRSIVGAGNDGVLVQRALLKLWGGIRDGATALTLSPDQQFAFCGGTDGSIRQWNLTDANSANVAPLKTFAGHTAPVTELSVSPNGLLLCSVSEDKALRVWKIADGSIVHALEHPNAVASVSVSPDSTRVVTGCADGILRLWDVTTGQLLESFTDHTAATAIQCVRFLSDGQTIVSSGDDKSLISHRTTVSRAIAVHTGATRSMVAYNGGVQVISAGDDARVVMTNLATGNKDREFTVGNHKAAVVAVRPDAQQIAAGCEAGEILVWNANDGTKTLQVLDVGAAVTKMRWSLDNRKLAVSTAKNMIHIFAPSVQGVQPPVELILHQQFTVASPINRLLFAGDSRSVWTALADGQIEEWAYAGLEQRRQFNHGGPVYGVAVTHDGSTVVSCSTDQTVRVWDTLTGQQKFQLNGHLGPIHAVALSPDETFAVSSGADGTLRLWDIVGGRQLKQLIKYDATMYSIAVHPQGALIAAAGADRKVHLLDMISGMERQAMTGHSDYLHSVTFSPDGSRLMSYGYAGQLKYWNTADGALLHENRIGRIGNTAQYSPSGRRIVVANGDGTVSIMPSGF